MDNIERLVTFIELGKKHNLKSLKIGDIEIQYHEKVVLPEQVVELGIPQDPMPTEDELLYASCGVDIDEQPRLPGNIPAETI